MVKTFVRDGYDMRFRAWSDDVAPRAVQHRGWFVDEFEDTVARGCVLEDDEGRLHAGFSDPWNDGMFCVETEPAADEVGAALAGDDMARRFAEDARERDVAFRSGQRARELGREALRLCREWVGACRRGVADAERLREKFEVAREEFHQALAAAPDSELRVGFYSADLVQTWRDGYDAC